MDEIFQHCDVSVVYATLKFGMEYNSFAVNFMVNAERIRNNK